jgi:RNA polymerase sigma factor (sigma-70 family)
MKRFDFFWSRRFSNRQDTNMQKITSSQVDRSSRSAPSRLTSDRDRLFAQFRPLVNRLLRKYADTPERRNDLQGEIFCLFCELIEAFDPSRGVPLKAYLVHQLTSATYTEARKHWRNQKREISLELYEEIPTKEDPTKKWDDEILLQQIRSLLPASIARLPTRQRQVVLWRYYDHLSFEEIAERLDIQPATVRSLLRHGMNALRRLFQEADIQL